MADRRQVMNFRIRAQQLDRARGTLDDTAVLDIGVQASGPDGGNWALAVRGVDVVALSGKDLVLLWTVRGAPHLYRRADVGKGAAPGEPVSAADAANRTHQAPQPFEAAGTDTPTDLHDGAPPQRDTVTP